MKNKKGTSTKRSTITVVAFKEWDHSLAVDDVVVCSRDQPALHFYRIKKMQRRQVWEEDLFNYPLLKERKIKPGTEYCPLVTLRYFRMAPTWDKARPPLTFEETIVDGYLLYKPKPEDFDPLITNLKAIKKEV